MAYLSQSEYAEMRRMLMVFFALPYSTDLDGKDVEKIIRNVKGLTGPESKRKELFDIVDGSTGYSVKTLKKPPTALVVDLQEQRFCDKEEMDRIRAKIHASPSHSVAAQGAVLLGYMRRRILEQMDERGVEIAKSAILLKYWDTPTKTQFQMRYWEEDFFGYIDDLWKRNEEGKIAWVEQPAGLHAQDPVSGLRLLRMHSKHNQIFTDHAIPTDATKIEFTARRRSWNELYEHLYSSSPS